MSFHFMSRVVLAGHCVLSCLCASRRVRHVVDTTLIHGALFLTPHTSHSHKFYSYHSHSNPSLSHCSSHALVSFFLTPTASCILSAHPRFALEPSDVVLSGPIIPLERCNEVQNDMAWRHQMVTEVQPLERGRTRAINEMFV